MSNMLQGIVDAMGETARVERSRYHVTLGKMIQIAATATGDVRFDDEGVPGREISYRGYYSDLSFIPSAGPKKASEFLAQCQAALGATYEGYKGGDFTMSVDTPLWRAQYGCCGDAIIKARVDANGDLILTCVSVDD